MILTSGLFGTPIELFGATPNQDLVFRSYTNSFANTKTWVTNAFTDFFNNCWGPNWWSDGRQIDDVEAIVQTQTPLSQVSDTNITGGSYAWHIRFTDTEGDLRHQVFYFNPTAEFDYTSIAASGCQTRKNFNMGYDDSGPNAVGVATGTFTPLDAGDVGSASWELQNTSSCIGNQTVVKRQCGKWWLEQVMGDGCHTAPVYQKEHGCNSGYATNAGDKVEVWKKKTASSTAGQSAFKIYQNVDETLPYKLVKYNCATGVEISSSFYSTRQEADTVGQAHVTSQYNTHGMTGDDDSEKWPHTISKKCLDDDADDDGPTIGPLEPFCDDDNATLLSDGSCGPCNAGYTLDSDNKCIATTDDDDDDDEEESSPTLKYILIGGGALMGLLVLKKIAS